MISWEEGPETLFQLANLEDISLGGLGVIADHALTAGREVKVSYGEGSLNGVVRHCESIGDRHFIGIQFVGVGEDASLQLQPELLFWAV
jgi:hypothetical protein